MEILFSLSLFPYTHTHTHTHIYIYIYIIYILDMYMFNPWKIFCNPAFHEVFCKTTIIRQLRLLLLL